MTTWHKGPPPSCGWWPCRGGKRIVLRWWDGQRWSLAADQWQGALVAAWCAARPEVDYMQPHIEWTKRPDWWPERSRT